MQPARVSTGIRLAEVIAALSLATDMGTGKPLERGLRGCLLAVHLGDALGVDERTLVHTYYVSLLVLIGCTSDSSMWADVMGNEIIVGQYFDGMDRSSMSEFMSILLRHVGEGEGPLGRVRRVSNALIGARNLKESSATHCEVGRRLSNEMGIDEEIQDTFVNVFELWNGKGMPRGLKGEDVPLPIRIIALANDMSALCRMGGEEVAVATAKERAGSAYDPAIVECFCRHSSKLLSVPDVESAWDAVLEAEPGTRPRLVAGRFDSAMRAIADFTDLKSPYTSGHSRAVGRLAGEAARRCKLPEADITAVEQAGLLHDLGRVGVTSTIWNKPAKLTAGEWEQVRLHPYYTERLLARSPVLAQLGSMAALHHERLDGSGYHKCLPATMLPPVARILAAADAYHAMTEPRPHRSALDPQKAAEELRRDVKAGRLDGEAVNAVLGAAGHRVPSARREYAAGLSEREIEVLRLVARGLSNKQMAGVLDISQKTVGHHIQHIYDKIGVSTRPAATLFAMQHDLLD